MKKVEIGLGDLVKDRITGFQGVVVAKTLWLNGCDRVMVQPQKLNKDGAVIQADHFDITQVELVKPGVVPPYEAVAGPRETGGPRPAPMRSPDPRR